MVIKTRSGLRESPVIKLGEKKMEDQHTISSLKAREMFLQDGEELNYGAKCIGHLQDRYDLQLETICWTNSA